MIKKITVNENQFINYDGTWYLQQEGNELFVGHLELIRSLDSIMCVDIALQLLKKKLDADS